MHKALNSCVCLCVLLTVTVSDPLCDEIAKMRRKIQHMSKSRTLFFDETAVRLSEAPTSTIVLPGEQPYVLASETEIYSKRLDMIACIAVNQTFAPVIHTPKE